MTNDTSSNSHVTDSRVSAFDSARLAVI